MFVIKFGGSSLAEAGRIQAAARIVAERQRQRGPVAVVVSAMAGVTDALLRVAKHAHELGMVSEELTEIGERYRAAYHEIAGEVAPQFDGQWVEVEADVRALSLPHAIEDRALIDADFSGWGERLMAPLFAAALRAAGIDAEPFLDTPVVLDSTTRPEDGPTASILATRAWLAPQLAVNLFGGVTPVLPGYIARDPSGRRTTLGRNGSDYSAAIIAAALGAEALFIYSDVAGIYSADPHREPGAILYTSLTYAQAAAIAARGAKILHPRTIEPLARGKIPLSLRSTLAPDAPGTDIFATR